MSVITKKNFNTLVAASVKVEEVQVALTEVFTRFASYKQQGCGNLSGLSMGSAWTVSDINYLYRLVRDLLLTIDGIKPDTLNNAMMHALAASGTNAGYQAFGSASGLNLIIGIAQVMEAVNHTSFAKEIGDKRGVLMDRIGILKGASLAAGGGIFGAYRAVEVAHCLKPSADALTKVGSLLSLTGTICYVVFFALLSVVFGIRLYEGAKLRHKLNGAKDIQEALAMLKNKLVVKDEKVQEKLNKLGNNEEQRAFLIKEGYESGLRCLKAMPKEMGLKALSDDELKDKINQIVGDNPDEFLKQVGWEIEKDKIAVKKETKLRRSLGSEAIKEIKKIAADLPLEEKERIVEVVKGASTREMAVQAFVLAVCLLGLGVMIGSIVFTGGGSLLPMAIIALVFGVGMFGVDGYYLIQSYKQEGPAPHDKKMLALSTAVGILAFLTVVGLMASGVVTMGILPTVVAFVLLALWLAQNGATWGVIVRKERQMHLIEKEEEEKRAKLIQELFRGALNDR